MRLLYNTSTLVAIAVVEETNSITAYPEGIQSIQGSEESVIIQALALGVDISSITSLNIDPETRTRVRRQSFGKKIYNRFLDENIRMNIPTEANNAILQAFGPLFIALLAGAIQTTYDNLLPEGTTALFMPVPGYASAEERKQSFMNEMKDFLDAEALLVNQ